MKNHWTHFINGYVKVKAAGAGAERLLNQCLRQRIYIWTVKQEGNDVITFFVSLKEIDKLRIAARGSACKVAFIERHGLPFFQKKILLNSGIAFGFILFLFIIAILSNMVWNVEVEGAQPETEHELRKVIQELGVTRAKFHFRLPDNDELQNKIMERMDTLTWVGVRLNGTSYHFQVVEKETETKNEKTGPYHLVATKNAVVYDMYVEQGQTKVQLNDVVKKGQLLVSGLIGNEKSTKLVGAKGEVLGLTWYLSTVEIPMETTFDVLTGNAYKKWAISWGAIKLPIWGFKEHSFTSFTENESIRPLYFLNYKLPIMLNTTTFLEQEQAERKYTNAAAIEAASAAAKEELMQKLPKDAIIKEEKVLQRKKTSGKVKITFYYTVIENIARKQTIIQGD